MTGDRGKWVSGWVGVGGTAVVLEPSGQYNRRSGVADASSMRTAR
jgi:hypothetical protein